MNFQKWWNSRITPGFTPPSECIFFETSPLFFNYSLFFINVIVYASKFSASYLIIVFGVELEQHRAAKKFLRLSLDAAPNTFFADKGRA
jgi:hypothetical protein